MIHDAISGKMSIKVAVAVLLIMAAGLIAYDVYAAMHIRKDAQVVLYDPGPLGQAAANDRVITVDGKPVFTYATAVNFNRAWSQNPKTEKTPVAYFDFSGTVTVKVRTPGVKIEAVTIRPLSLGIKPVIKDDTLSFRLDKPAKLTIEINNNLHRAIHLFANPIETDPPKEGDPDVVYFGPGIHDVGKIEVQSNQTVYIAGGAVVHGFIKATGLDNVKIIGRGIIDGSVYDRWKDGFVPIDLQKCTNCTVDGITILDPAAWALNVFTCENITIDNVNIITARSNGDGITTQSCRNLTASNCFVRGWDDNLVVKGYDGDVSGITFDNIILWTDLAQSCEVGYETRANIIEDVAFKNITVLHNFHKPVLSIHNSDQALVRNVSYSNIVVEDAQMGQGDGAGSNFLIDIMIAESQWSQSETRGNVRDITYDNIKVLDGELPAIHFQGFDEEHTVENVEITGLEVLGRKIGDIGSGKFYLGDFIKNIDVR
ncbi:MAG TPA: glycosyl hydrolase family 28 protein [Clostridia bacterium]|nr:glycosyl hydrolase family 28 protein [Clostridia bacterium]